MEGWNERRKAELLFAILDVGGWIEGGGGGGEGEAERRRQTMERGLREEGEEGRGRDVNV